MDSSKKPWPLSTVYGINKRIDTNPDYQRPAVWTKSQKQLLVDTILRNYDVPKIYWRRTTRNPDQYDVVDGQQRLRAIWDFFMGEFGLPKNADDINGYKIAGLKYSQLPDDLRMQFDVYPLDIVTIESSDEDEVREMFLRLQNGTTLKAQEKRNAFPGKMRDFVKGLADHSFFKSVAFSNARYTHDLVAAQLICLELAGGPSNVKDADLNKMYRENLHFDLNDSSAKSVERVLELLSKIFKDKTPELTRYSVISLYCVVSELIESYVREQFQPLIHDWLIEFEKKRREQDALSEEEADSEWITYKEKVSHSTDTEESISWRMNFMLKDFLISNPNLNLKDNQREFKQQQRIAIFRRDKGICQLKIKCDGEKLKWDNWHCDHLIPWIKGGPTTVQNGQVACAACNLAKGSNEQ